MRLETKLSERESNITHLTETLQKSEQTTKEIRHALNKSETDNNSLRSEVERLKKQLHGVAGLHAKVIELETEHDKSKKRREKEISSLKTELRLAEDRASQHLTDKTNLKGDLERLQTLSETTERLRQSTFCKNNQELMKYLEQVFHESHANQRTREISTSLSRLDDVHTRKVLADRASQVAELVSLVQQAESREDMLYEVFDSLLETSDMQMQQLIDIEVDLSCEREQLSRTSVESRTESKTVEQLLDQQLREKDLECQIAQQLTSLTQAELSEALKIRSSLEQTLMDSSEAYQELSRVCKSKSKDLEKARAELENSSSKITELINSIQVLESQVVQLNDQIRRAHEDHSLATEAWNQKQYELQSTLKKLENNIREEKAKYNKLSGELMLTRQAEASLRGELEQ
jgi:chromosome segregation ATPase